MISLFGGIAMGSLITILILGRYEVEPLNHGHLLVKTDKFTGKSQKCTMNTNEFCESGELFDRLKEETKTGYLEFIDSFLYDTEKMIEIEDCSALKQRLKEYRVNTRKTIPDLEKQMSNSLSSLKNYYPPHGSGYSCF
jgi:hypothetical protein